jgi:hypothetical protein
VLFVSFAGLLDVFLSVINMWCASIEFSGINNPELLKMRLTWIPTLALRAGDSRFLSHMTTF